MRRALILPVLVAVSAVLGCGKQGVQLADAPPPSEGRRSPFFGINGGGVFSLAIRGKARLVDPHLAQIAAAPISYVRAGVQWRRIEPEPPKGGKHEYDFSDHDAWVKALASHGLRWAPNLLPIPIPAWAADLEKAYAGCSTRAPPKGTRHYSDFVSAIAERYGTGGSLWKEHPQLPYRPVTEYEIWNAPNHFSFWCPRPDPPAFARLAMTASRAIRAADRRAEIILGGLGGFLHNEPPDKPKRMAFSTFLNAAVTAEPALLGAFDAVGIHTYGANPAAILHKARQFRRALNRTGFGAKPMVVNEFGWPRRGDGGFVIPGEEARAEALRTVIEALYRARRALDIESVAPFTWVTSEMDPQDHEQWFGLTNPRTTAPYVSGSAYREAVEQLSSGR